MSNEISKQSKGVYHHVYLSKVASAIQACHSLRSLSHSGEKGRLREVLLRSMFRPLLPAGLGVGTGFVIASDGQQSSQQDIVLYDGSTLPPAMLDDESGFFPIESVLCTIEVKTTLTRRELELAHESARKIGTFPLVGKDSTPVSQGPQPDAAVFALSSDLIESGMSEDDRYTQVRGSDRPYVGYICVVGRGYWWCDSGQFRRWPERYDLSEVMGFLTGIMNKLPRMYEERRAARPALGAYLSDYGADFSAVAKALLEHGGRVRASAQRGEAGRPELITVREQLQVLTSQIDSVFEVYRDIPDDSLKLLFQKMREERDQIAEMIETALAVLDSIARDSGATPV